MDSIIVLKQWTKPTDYVRYSHESTFLAYHRFSLLFLQVLPNKCMGDFLASFSRASILGINYLI